MVNEEERLVQELYRMVSDSSPKKLHEVITARMSEFGITAHQVSKLINIDKNKVARILTKLQQGDTDSVDFFAVLKLSQFLNIGIEEVSQFFVASLKPALIGEIEMARKASFILRRFDLKTLKSIGFINDVNDIPAIEKRITDFFEIQSIYEYDYEVGGVLFSQVKNSIADKNREFWVRTAYKQFEKVDNQNPYDEQKLKALIPKIKPHTRYEEKGFLAVIQALAKVGVTVIVQSYLTKTTVRGATFAVKGKPCIVLTDFNKSYSTVWFSLMHELCHVLYDFEEIKIWNCHLTGESEGATIKMETDLFDEERANHFANEMLFPKDKMNYIQHHINNTMVVSQYAKENGVHPSIIYGFYCYGKDKSVWQKFNPMLGKSEKMLRTAKTFPFDKNRISIEVDKIRQMLQVNT